MNSTLINKLLVSCFYRDKEFGPESKKKLKDSNQEQMFIWMQTVALRNQNSNKSCNGTWCALFELPALYGRKASHVMER